MSALTFKDMQFSFGKQALDLGADGNRGAAVEYERRAGADVSYL